MSLLRLSPLAAQRIADTIAEDIGTEHLPNGKLMAATLRERELEPLARFILDTDGPAMYVLDAAGREIGTCTGWINEEGGESCYPDLFIMHDGDTCPLHEGE